MRYLLLEHTNINALKKIIYKVIVIFGKLRESIISTIWVILKFKKFKFLLKSEYNISNVRILNLFNWHLGCKYFIATSKKGEKIFIKTGGKQSLISREIQVLKLLNRQKEKSTLWSIPRVINYRSEGHFNFLAIEYIEASSLSKFIMKNDFTIEEKKSMLNQFNNINIFLKNSNIIHRDITPDNILIKRINNEVQVILIDFAFAISPVGNSFGEVYETERHQRLLLGLGKGFNPKPLKWDDAYSLCKIFLIVDNEIEKYHSDYLKLYSSIDKLTYSKL